MRKEIALLLIILTVFAGAAGIYFLDLDRSNVEKKPNSINSNELPKQNEKNSLEIAKKSNDYFFPLPDYFSRINVKKFGQLVKPTDHFDVACGAEFAGIHDGDDLEVTSTELNSQVAVHAAAAGKVLQVGHVSGYGGLLVQSATLDGGDVTIYYGHINYVTAKVSVGDTLAPGKTIAFLGNGCSAQTDGERKHLHFAIHNGNSVDVRGYVPSENVLINWINPGETLKNLNASESEN